MANDREPAPAETDLAHDIYKQRDRTGRRVSRVAKQVRERRRHGRRWVAVLIAIALIYTIAGLAYVVMHQRSTSKPAPSPPPPEGAETEPAFDVPASDGLLAALERLREQGRRETADLPEFHRLLDRGLISEAEALAERALEAAPESVVWRTARARVRLQMGHLREAEKDCLAVLAAQPRNFEARETLAVALLMQSRPAPAYTAARWVLEDDPNRTAALETAARAAIEGGLYPDAVMHVRRWLELRPGHAPARDLLGLAYLRSGEYGKAAFVLEDLARDPAATEATFLNLALVYAALRQPGDVTRVLGEAAQRLSPKTVIEWFSRADFAQFREEPKVMAFVEQLLAGAPAALALRLPEPAATPAARELTLGLSPPTDVLWTRQRVER